MEETDTLVATASQASIGTLATDFQAAIDLRITSPNNLAKIIPYFDYRQFDRTYPDPSSAEDGTPILWYTFGGEIRVYPAPDQAYTFELNYIKKPTALTLTGDVPDVPAEFEELMVLGMYKRALEHEDNFDQAQVIQSQFDDLLEKMVLRLSQRQIGTIHRMSTGRMRTVSGDIFPRSRRW